MTYIFDLDGTLYDKKGLKKWMALKAIRDFRPLKMFLAEKKSREELCLLETGEVSYERLYECIAKYSGRSVDHARRWYEQWYMPSMVAQIRRHCPLRPGIREKLDRIKAEGDAMIILSDYGCIHEKLQAIGLDESYFSRFLDSPSIGGYKPSARVFRNALEIIGARPEDCVMIGDNPVKDGGSEKVGIRYIHIEDFLKQ